MKQDIQTLKDYFETGDKPSQQNYADLIDSLGMPMVGEIKTMSFGFAPEGWKKCNGQLLDPTQYPTLFTLIGTIYGGDGVTTFGLPNLVGRIPLGFGTTNGLSSYAMAQTGGEEAVQLTEDQLPSHNHDVIINSTGSVSIPVNSTNGESDTLDPTQGVLSYTGDDLYASSHTNEVYNGSSIPVSGTDITTDSKGNNNNINNVQPYLAVNYIIAVEGINPS